MRIDFNLAFVSAFALISAPTAHADLVEDFKREGQKLIDGTIGVIERGAEDVAGIPDKAEAFANAVLTGDKDALVALTGSIMMQNQNCEGCRFYAEQILPSLTPEQIDKIVGRGTIVFLGTGDPYITFFDMVGSTREEIKISQKPPERPPFIQDAPAERGVKSYSISATCLMTHNDLFYIASPSDFVLTSAEGGSWTYPQVDLKVGDVITVSATEDCSYMNDASKNMIATTSATGGYVDYTPAPSDDPEKMKHWFTLQAQ